MPKIHQLNIIKTKKNSYKKKAHERYESLSKKEKKVAIRS